MRAELKLGCGEGGDTGPHEADVGVQRKSPAAGCDVVGAVGDDDCEHPTATNRATQQRARFTALLQTRCNIA